ncbi:hypothetical protein CRYUN_Cryun32bG0085600 [Craigia yunnanensis]
MVERGRMSMCEAERRPRLIANALLDISNEWFILLSESCIPLYNFSIIYHYISRSRHSFMGSFDELGPYGRGRRLAINIIEDTTDYPKFKEFCRPACYVDEHYFPTMLASNCLISGQTGFLHGQTGQVVVLIEPHFGRLM